MSDDSIRFTAKMKGASDVARLLNRYPEKVGRTLESLVKQEARGLAVELARNTRPFGFSREGEEARREGGGRGHPARSSPCPTRPTRARRRRTSGRADRFWANIQNRRFARAGRHSPSRRRSGRLCRSVGSIRSSTRRAAPVRRRTSRAGSQPRSSPAARRSTPTSPGSRSGSASPRATWIKAAKAIGGRVRGAAQWATRHKQAPGTATVKTGDKPAVTLVSRLDYMDDVTTEKGIRLALEVAAGRLRKALATSLRKINERANRSLRRRAG